MNGTVHRQWHAPAARFVRQVAAMATAWVLLAGTVRAGDEVSFASLLREMADRSALTRWPVPPYRSLQASSYNRAAKTPDEPGGWFTNGDCGFVIRTETNSGRKECILMEHDGPGVITRVWTPYFYRSMGNRKGTNVRVYIDGEAEPRLTANLIELVTGKGAVKPPFAQYTVRAGDLYLPIPFAKSCRITQEEGAFYYIINYRAYADGTRVESFRPEMLDRHKALMEETGKKLTDPSAFSGGKGMSLAKSIQPKQSESLDLPPGPGAVRHLEIRLQADNLAQALRSTVLEMTFDDVQAVWCPVGDFFSNVNGIDPFRTWQREVKADGTMICRWVMPYRTGGSVRLQNLAAAPVMAELKAAVSAQEWTKDSLHFRTNWWTDVPYPPRPPRDMTFIEVKGRGVHVGDTLVVLNPLWSWWGEGDEKIYVDGDFDHRFPSHFGTGSEDYYGWAGGEVPTRRDEFCMPFLANVRVGGQKRDWPAGKQPYTHGYNICTRTRSLDATPFEKRFRLDMEAFNMIGTPDAYLQYALVTHWYGDPAATHNRPPMPDWAAKSVPQTEDVAAAATAAPAAKAFAIKDAIEMEGVKEVKLSPGLRAGVQKIGLALPPHRWSGESQFWARATKPGEWAAFTLLEQYQPRQVTLYPTVSYDYGLLDIYVNDKLVVAKWDGYDPASRPGKPIDLGVQVPDGNVLRLKFVVAGKNEKSKGYFFGLDAVVLGEQAKDK
ncbi:MAG: hypothetical protein BWX88_03580 [Planctomycetes bacterium ADurb.Bin126]|nr:MAG: hypothetical protein BWX88_03580 [Planctomycetes bacterium ADurb.Bin126]